MDSATTGEEVTRTGAVLADATSSSAGFGAVMDVALSLALVLALIAVVAWVLRRVGGLTGSHGALAVRQSLPLGTRDRLLLVQAGETWLLLGASSSGIRRLHVFDSPPEDLHEMSPDAGDSPFAQQFRRLMAARRKP